MMTDKESIETKVKNLKQKFKLDSNNSDKYLKEALFVADYKTELQDSTTGINPQPRKNGDPNRRLAIVGDRFLKLVLAEETYKAGKNPEEMNNITNKFEKNKNLYKLRLVAESDGYSMRDGIPKEVENEDGGGKSKVISTLTEAVIGALYLGELEEKGTAHVARAFVKENIIPHPDQATAQS